MISKRHDLVSKLDVSGKSITPGDSSAIMKILQTAKKGDITFDVKVDTSERIPDPFEELHKSANLLLSKQKKKMGRQTWDSLVFASSSPKYITAFEKVKPNDDTPVFDKCCFTPTSENAMPVYECEDLCEMIDKYMQEECLSIEPSCVPREMYRRLYGKTAKIKIKDSSAVIDKENPTDLLKKSDFFISPPNCHIFEEESCLSRIDQYKDQLTWNNLDQMKSKCTKWLNDNVYYI